MSYTYRPLRSARSIRVIELLPADSLGAPTECEIHRTSIDDVIQGRTHYEALSYFWGETVGSRPIFCDKESILVTLNCEAAMRHL
jgi:hypothetical protein